MVELFSTYSGSQLVIILFLVAVAAKEAINLVEYFVKRFKARVLNNSEKENDSGDVHQTLNSLNELLKETVSKVNVLMESDKDAIKSWIVREWSFFQDCPERLNTFEMDCLEKRYTHYKQEGGNTYVDNIMDDLREIHHNNNTQTNKEA